LFTIPEVLALLLFGYLIFDVGNRGSFLELLVVIVMGGATFAGLGLLFACRARRIGTVSGLLILVLLPGWFVSAVLFPVDRSRDAAERVIGARPVRALTDALRGVMLEGKSLIDLAPQLGTMAAGGVVSFVVALRFFRWR